MTGPVAVALHLGARALERVGEGAGHIVTRLRDHALAAPGTHWVPYRGTSVVASPWKSASDAIASTLAACEAALAGVPHTITHVGPGLPTITVTDWEAALRALRSSTGAALYLDGLRPVPMARASATTPARVFRAWAYHNGRFAAGPDVGVVFVTGPVGEPEPEFDIDFVFTWVDGGDPAWQARRRRRETRGALHPTAINDARFLQIDELRYALRAVERFAPWRRRVFLVTDRQRPAWLTDEFPHVAVVDHSEIFDDPEALPTFNSHAIESRLHHIPGLAEHWVYLNDDVFLARYTPPSTFFTADGRLRAFLAGDPITEPTGQPDEPVIAAARNNSAVLERLTGASVGHKMKHVPHPQLRSLTLELESHAAEEFHRTHVAPFRQPTDLSVASSLAPHYALATGRGVLGDVRHFYADVASPELRWRLPRLLEWRDADVICLNATSASPEGSRVRLATFLERYLG